MIILENPNKNKTITYYFEGECYHCSCRFECEKHETYSSIFEFCMNDYAHCPNCNTKLQVYSRKRVL